MPRLMRNKNTWGIAGTDGVDQQRTDLFRVSLTLPTVLQGAGGGTNVWDQHIAFAIQKWPFSARGRETIPTKYLNQTNHQIGADTASEPIEIDVRYAFNQRTAEWLEKWHWITSNPRTGGVAATSQVKTNGKFYYLVPNIDRIKDLENTSDDGVLVDGGSFTLEGCLVKGLKNVDSDMTQGNTGVTLAFTLIIDRYYPDRPSDLTFNGATLTTIASPPILNPFTGSGA